MDDRPGAASSGGAGDVERLRAEARAAREQLESVLAGISDQFLALDRDWRYVFVNDRVSEVTGKSREELLGHSLWELFPDTAGSELELELRRAMAGRAPVHFEYFYPPLSRWFENRAYPTASGLTLFVADITERKLAEEALRQSERQLRLVTDAVPALIAYVDSERRYRFNNRAYVDWFGPEAAEIRGKHLVEVVGEAAYEAARPSVDAVLAGRTLAFEATLPYKNGGPRYVHVHYIPDFGERGEVLGYYALITDLSERRRVEEALRASEERLQLALDVARAGAWDWDVLADQVTGDEGLARLFDLPAAEVLAGRLPAETYFRALHAEDRRQVDLKLQEVFATGGDYEIEYRLAPAGKPERWLASRGRAELGAEGQLERLTGLVFDITARKEAERQTRFLFELDAALAPLADPEDIERTAVEHLGGYLEADHCYFAQITGQRAAVHHEYRQGGTSIAGGYDLDDFFTPEARDQLAEGIATVVDDVTADPRTARSEESAASFAALGIGALIIVPVRYHDRWVGALTCVSRVPRAWRADELHLMRNLAARVWPLLEQARAVQALRQADRRKDEFLAMLAHELRNPLAPIRNAAEVLKLADPPDAQQRWAREVIERQTQHLTRLVDDLLDVSRITRGKVTLQREPLDLAAIAQRAVETSRPAIDARRHRLTVTLPAEPVQVEGDLTRLVQVLGNLLNNAAKYTEEAGHIWLVAARKGNEAVLSVRDDGMGLSDELLPHVFDLFTQADRSLDRSQGGLGIGLTLVRQLVEL
ncbi:MAG TPA: PAS domain-containing protein, partial [Thermoanaerobaculia bacterium]|nr:PAS domain-containing protein [Thermoanaerobaculia bacterium]